MMPFDYEMLFYLRMFMVVKCDRLTMKCGNSSLQTLIMPTQMIFHEA